MGTPHPRAGRAGSRPAHARAAPGPRRPHPGRTTQLATTYNPDGTVATRTVTLPGLPPQVTATTYDDQGRVATVTEPGGRVTTYGYDALGRKTSERRSDSEIAPDGSERPVERLTTWSYDPLGRTVIETRPDGATITRTTDAAGNLVAYTDHDGNTTTYAYTCLGQLARITYPDGTSRSFTYTDDGQLDTLTRADGSVVQHDYTAAGRLARIHVTTYAATLPPEGHWSHDTHLTFDLAGQLTEAHTSAAAVAFTYDSLGRQTAETLTLDAALIPGFGTKTVTRTLDDGGRATALALPSGATVTRAYTPGDALQRLSVGATTLWSAQLAGSVPTAITRGNGLVSTWSHSPALLPVQVDTATPTLPTHSHGYTWTAGQLRRGIARDDTARQRWRFQYDGAGHLETGNGIPAVRATAPDLPVPPGTDPATLRREDWQVNLVDELTSRSVTQDGRLSSVTLTTNPLHQVVAKRRQIGGVAELTTYTWTPDGALRTSAGPDGTTTLVHDWRDRLVEASTPAAVTAELVLDPLGRLVAKRTTTPAGTLHRAYLHDGDQVVEEYASVPGQTGVRLARRHHWGRWIDDLVAEQVDTDGDGTLETTLYPVTDLLGSVELLTDEDGRIVERIAYDPDGTPRFWGEDTTRPRVTQLAWTGGGQSPAGVTVAASTLVLRFSEAIHAATMAGLSLTLTPDPGSRTQALDGDGRTLTVTFEQPIPANTPTALHLEGLADRTGNTILPFETTFTLADSQAYAVLADTAAPRIEAVIDTQSGLVLTFDEPVQPPQGTPLAGAVTITRSGLPVSGTTSRLTETALAWTPTEPASWQPGGEYRVTALTLQDLHSQPNPVQTASLPLTITHLATQPADAILAYTAPTDSVQLAASQYGQTALFQGREWHADLGMYYYRARWMSGLLGAFAERDPIGYATSPSIYGPIGHSSWSFLDPFGLTPFSWFTGLQAHALFEGWVRTTRWYGERVLRGRIGTNISVLRTARDVLKDDGRSAVAKLGELYRPDAFWVPRNRTETGEFFELKPVSYLPPGRRRELATIQVRSYVTAFALQGISVRPGDARAAFPETTGGLVIPGVVIGLTKTLYDVKLYPDVVSGTGLLFYSLQKRPEPPDKLPPGVPVVPWAWDYLRRDAEDRAAAREFLRTVPEYAAAVSAAVVAAVAARALMLMPPPQVLQPAGAPMMAPASGVPYWFWEYDDDPPTA
ncbi:MAG: hypothetical protein AB2L07_05740 [Thermoanaerobaculaceae bacterium]